MEIQRPGFSKAWKISRNYFQALENTAAVFPRLGKTAVLLCGATVMAAAGDRRGRGRRPGHHRSRHPGDRHGH